MRGLVIDTPGKEVDMPIYSGLKRSRRMVLLAVAFIAFAVTSCGTLKNGRGWGQDAIYPVDLKRIPRAAINALIDPQTLIPVAGALVFTVNHFDRKVSDWATRRTPIFGSKDNANKGSDYLLYALYTDAIGMALATPSGDNQKEWAYSKAKGIIVEGAAELVTTGTTSLLKVATSRERPDGGDKSFPSGHASAAFSSATLANRNLDSISVSKTIRLSIQISNILLATGVGWARVEAGKHFPSDVLAGAALGHFLSAFVHDAFMGLPEDERIGFYLLPSKHGAMIGLWYAF
jgi:membrane-associated phospholipid phosphatase